MGRWLLLLPPLLFAGLAVLFVTGMNRSDPDALPSMAEGRLAPPVTLAPFAGAAGFDDAALRAPGMKLVNFWASWCAPCRAEHAMLRALADEGIAIYGVNYKDRPEDAKAYLADLGSPYRALGADAGRMALDWGVYGVPETYVIDGAGKVVLRFAGPITRQELDRTLRPAMGVAAKPSP